MGRTSAVAGVSTRLFEDGWDRIKGGRQLAGARQMARAAQGASPAFFKMIRTGGCASKGQLSAQFSYLFSKSVDVHDSRGLLDGEKRLTPEQIERAVARWTDDWQGQLNAARTSHMVMSFPRNAKSQHVSMIAGEICKEKLGGRFDYMIAVHTDSPNKNPHAHIIVNRRGREPGDYFTLRQGTEYTYQAFKEAMVDHAARYGIQLEATTRLQRGHIQYPPTDGAWRRAQEKAATTGAAFEAPSGTPRVGDALRRATDEVRDWSLRYREFASFASLSNMQDLATAFEKASAVLSQGGVILAKGDAYMSVEEDFDKAAADLRRAVDSAEVRIADAAPNHRPAMERKLAEALSSVEHLQPLGARSRDLSETASEEGIYSAQNVEGVNARFAVDGRSKLAMALDGTGIDPVEVEARMRLGANSAALETRWVQQDLQSVADLRGLNLRDAAQLDMAIAVVDHAYDRVAADYGVDDAIHQRAAAQHGLAIETSERGHDTTAQIERARVADAQERAPVASIGSRDAMIADHSELARRASPVGAEDERKLREAVEKALTRDELTALKNGDASVLRGVGDRQDQLTLARDYLRASDDLAARQGLSRVNDELSEERVRVLQERGHQGGGHA
ncbi:relaxase/mobilization nuclease domain-containing protein [Paracoccus sp. 08]|uniref:relaxase/mobilization nuclease domain-containing protein n=1 Tax=Paracoccus sp. 08 TaxID=2606624 RepID=UPI0020948121|nr:relaxase/mobilization nuclease domain-containing protein [Paracoccus sp. 08]MCO6364433.1 relaxase/mobilization nuclease domain-containing protein [Paracoccus sp. 08]